MNECILRSENVGANELKGKRIRQKVKYFHAHVYCRVSSGLIKLQRMIKGLHLFTNNILIYIKYKTV
jgi:hypothetical protein